MVHGGVLSRPAFPGLEFGYGELLGGAGREANRSAVWGCRTGEAVRRAAASWRPFAKAAIELYDRSEPMRRLTRNRPTGEWATAPSGSETSSRRSAV